MVPNHSIRRVFEQAFSVRDIAQALPSFDDTASAGRVQSIMLEKRITLVGVRTNGSITGFLEPSDLGTGCCGEYARQIEDADVVTDSMPLAPLVLRLKEHTRLFVQSFEQISGVVSRFDLQRPPGRMWLFGMITLIETRFGNMIVQHCPGDSWQQFLSEGRIRKALWLQSERHRRDQQVSLADCLQFADKVSIIARNTQLRNLTRFESKRQVEDIGKRLENLRNNLAHVQDISTDWETIVALAEQLDSVLAGPDSVSTDA